MHRGAGGSVFGGDPTVIAHGVNLGAKAGQIEPAAARFVAAGKAGDLDMGDLRFMTVPDRLGVAFDPGGVPQVKLQTDLRQEIARSNADLHKFFERKFMWLMTAYCGGMFTLLGFLGKYLLDSYAR